MGWFTYKCMRCGETTRVVLDEREPEIVCEHESKEVHGPCGGKAKPILKASNIKVMERLDNGLMPRRVERIHNIEEILQERSDKHSGPQDEE